MMNQRPEQLEQLSAYLDGELTDAERAAVERLLAADPAARALLDELRRTAELVAGLPRAAAPPDFTENAVARLERAALLGETPPPVGTARRAGWPRGLALAASLALVATAGWLARPHRWTEAPPPHVVAVDDRDAPPPQPRESATPETLARRTEPGEQPASAGEKNDAISSPFHGRSSPHPATESETPVAALATPPAAAEPPATPPPPDEVDAPVRPEQPDQARTADAKPAGRAALPGESPPDRSARAAGPAADAGRGGSADGSVETASGRGSSADEEAVTLETLLAEGVMTRADLAAWPAEQAAHHATVEADEPTLARLTATIREFLHGRGVPDLAESGVPEPVGLEQAFFVVRPAAAAEPAAAVTKPRSPPPESPAAVGRLAAADGTQVLCRIPRDEVERLLEPVAAVSSGGAPSGPLAACSGRLPATNPADGVLGKDRDALKDGRPAASAAATQPADGLVTLVITLRPASPSAASRPAGERPASAPATATQPASPPTTRGAERG